MSSKTTNLSPEDKKKLLALVSEEEKILDDANMTDEELWKEELALSQEISRLVGEVPPAKGEDHAQQDGDQTRNWEAIKKSLETHAKPQSDVVVALPSRSIKKTQWSLLFMAAASIALFMYVANKPKHIATIDPLQESFKGINSGEGIDCDYEFIGRSSGSLKGNGLVFQLATPQSVNLRMNCADAAFVHIRVSGREIQTFLNGTMDTGLVMFGSDPWAITVESNVEISLFVTQGELGSSDMLTSLTEESSAEGEETIFKWRDTTQIEVE